MLAIRSANLCGRSSLRVPACKCSRRRHSTGALLSGRSSLFLLCGPSLSSTEKAEAPSVARSAGRPLSRPHRPGVVCRLRAVAVLVGVHVVVRTCLPVSLPYRCGVYSGYAHVVADGRGARRDGGRFQTGKGQCGAALYRTRLEGDRRPQGDGRPRRSPPAPHEDR
jgi:hypothetical protein